MPDTIDVVPTQPTCFATDSFPSHIRTSYRRLALVTHEQQLRRINDDDTLVVLCDWLLWQRAVTRGEHCVHYEQGIALWDEPDTLDSDLMILSNSWMYADGKDVTLFNGVSLGKLFHSESLFCHINIIRLERALQKLIEKFDPREIEFFDYANDINVLGKDMRKRLAQEIAHDRQLYFVDASSADDPEAFSIAENLLAPPPVPTWHRWLLKRVYGAALSTASRLRVAFDRKPCILLLLGGNTIEPLTQQFRPGTFTPAVLARTVPKRWRSLLRCLRNGIRLLDITEASLSAVDRDRLRQIRSDLAHRLVDADSARARIVHQFILRNFIDSTKPEALAVEVLKAEKQLASLRPARIVVDGVRNPPPRIYVELAGRFGCKVDYLWHSPMVPQYLKFDALGGDPNTVPMVDRCLSWGPMNDHWLNSVEAKMPRVRVGSPLSDRYSGWKSPPQRPSDLPISEQNVLVLQYAPILSDLKSQNASLYSCFVELVRQLNDEGFRNIRFKLHPGPGRWKKDYFETIAAMFGIDCKIMKTEPFSECVSWADIIVGPAQTGAFFETLAAGKPYYAYILEPNSYDVSCYEGYPIYASVEDVVAGVVNAELDAAGDEIGENLLDRLYSTREYPSGSRRLWHVLANDINGNTE
jgi:hypothetical protein